jgi:hypothetical protein
LRPKELRIHFSSDVTPHRGQDIIHAFPQHEVNTFERRGCENGRATMFFWRSRRHPDHSTDLRAVIHRDDSKPASVHITRLWYSGCEFKSDKSFKSGQRIRIEIHGMGSIIADVVQSTDVVLASFVEDSPV